MLICFSRHVLFFPRRHYNALPSIRDTAVRLRCLTFCSLLSLRVQPSTSSCPGFSLVCTTVDLPLMLASSLKNGQTHLQDEVAGCAELT